MKLAFSKPTRDAGAQRRLFAGYPAHGFDGLQLKNNQYGDYVAAEDGPERFRADWGDAPGHVESLITMNPLDAAGIGRLRDLVRFGAGVGAARVVLCHDARREGLTDADLVGFAGLLSELAQEAREQNVRLSLHHHTDQPVMHRRDFEVFFGAVRPDTLTLTVDTGHLAKSGISEVGLLISDLAAFVDNIHLKDYADSEFRLLGRGEVDLEGALAAIVKLGDGVTLCVDEESRAALDEGFEVSRRYLRDHGIGSPDQAE